MESTMFENIFLFILGLILLYLGAEFLVRGSSRLALLARISPIVIGLTVVAFGTSFPEFVTSIVAAWQDKIDLAIGNIVGSNIANICLILGVSGLLVPVIIKPRTVNKELYWMLGASILFWIFGYDGIINHLEGVVLFAGIIAFSLNLIRDSIIERKNIKAEGSITQESARIHRLPVPVRLSIYLVMTLGGIFLLMLGSNWLIESAANIARVLGVSEVVIGLSLVAFGTSLPELATAIIAIVRKENEILLGNIVGSNIFNILFVGGVLSTFFTAPINNRIITIDLPIMLILSLFLVIIVIKQKIISRLTGFILLVFYILYIVYIFLNQA
jgi:cation:H+ antiporter